MSFSVARRPLCPRTRHKGRARLCAEGRVLSSGARLRSLGLSGARLGAFGCAVARLEAFDARPSRLFDPGPLVRHQPANQQTSPTGPTSPTSPTSPIRFHFLRYPSFVDKNRRYVSLPTPRRRRVQKMRSCDLVFCENAATLLIGQLESGSHIGDFCPRRANFKKERGATDWH